MSKSLLPVTKRWLWRVKPWHSHAQHHPVKVELAILHRTDDDLCTVPLTGFHSLEAQRQWSCLNVLPHWSFAQLLHPAWQVADRRGGGPMSSLFKFCIDTRCSPVTSDRFAKGDPITNKSRSYEHGGIETPLLHEDGYSLSDNQTPPWLQINIKDIVNQTSKGFAIYWVLSIIFVVRDWRWNKCMNYHLQLSVPTLATFHSRKKQWHCLIAVPKWVLDKYVRKLPLHCSYKAHSWFGCNMRIFK